MPPKASSLSRSARLVSIMQAKLEGPSKSGTEASAHLALGGSPFGNNGDPFCIYPCLPFSLQNSHIHTHLASSRLAGDPRKFTATLDLGLLLSPWADPILARKCGGGHGSLVVTLGADCSSSKEKMPTRQCHPAVATEARYPCLQGCWEVGTSWQGQRGQGRGCGLFFASVHLGFHEQRLPLLCGHRSPLLLLLEVLLLGQQHFLGVHTCLEEEG